MPNKNTITRANAAVFEIPKGAFLWWRSDKGITLNSGAVSAWEDVTGRGAIFSQGTAIKQPLYQENQLNGHPVITFDGSNDFFKLNTLGFSQSLPMSKYAVIKLIAWGGYNRILNGGLANCLSMQIGTPKVVLANNGSYPTTSISLTVGTYFIVSMELGASVCTLQRNQDSPVTMDNGGGASEPGGTYMGIYTNEISFPGNFSIAELITFNRSLSVGDDEKVKNYLKNRYNL